MFIALNRVLSTQIELAPDSGQIYFNRALLYKSDEDFDHAMADFVKGFLKFRRTLQCYSY
jgi:hypothetical protein